MKDDIIIHTREEWGAVNVSENFERNPALGIVIHNMENANRTPESDSTAELVIAFQKSRDCQHDQMHRPKPFSDTGQNFTISRGGVVMEGRKGSIDAAYQGKVSRGAHASGVTHFNKHFHGIELEGDFRQSLQITAQQKDALINLCAHLRLWVENSPDSEWQVVPHAEVLEGHTDCPGKLIDHMDGVRVGIRARINELLLGTEGDGGVPQADEKVLKSTILRDNDVLEGVAAGHLVLRTTGREVAGIGPVQDALNFLGKANPALGIELGRFRGFFGEKTENAVEAFQQAAGLDVDGRIGEDDIKALDAAVVAAAGDGGFQRSVDVLGDDEMLQPAPDATPVGDPEPFATKGSK